MAQDGARDHARGRRGVGDAEGVAAQRLGEGPAASARGDFGSPGISMIFPVMATKNPAPAATRTSRTFSVQPVGRVAAVNSYVVGSMTVAVTVTVVPAV